jgi:hypothetical protein
VNNPNDRNRALAGQILLVSLFLTPFAVEVYNANQPSPGDGPPAPLVVSEFAWMGTSASHHDEWIELANNTDHAIDLAGWSLSATDGTPSIPLSGTIPAGGHFLLETTDDDSVPGVAADQVYAGALTNDGEDLTLYDAAANVVG